MTHNPISTPISLSHLFRLRRDERWMMLVVALLLVALNALTIIHYYGVFTPITDHYWNLFVGKFHMSSPIGTRDTMCTAIRCWRL